MVSQTTKSSKIYGEENIVRNYLDSKNQTLNIVIKT